MAEWRPGVRIEAELGAVARSDGSILELTRDLVGERTLFYGRLPDGTVIYDGSLGAVIRGMNRPPLDLLGLVAYLSTGYVPGPGTLVSGISAVPPATRLCIDASGRITAHPLALPEVVLPEGDEAQRLFLRRALEEAVARNLPDGAVAASLSGGIDSSLVAAIAARRRALCALSITFGPEHRDELQWSSLVARHIDARHEIVTIRPDDIRARFDDTVAALSIPNGDPLTVPNDALFSTASQLGHAVMLNGEGGDPCFGGPKNAPMLLAELYGEGGREAAYLRAHQKLWDELHDVLHPDIDTPALREQLAGLVTPHLAPDGRSLLDRLMALNVLWKGAGHILPKVEHLAARHGVSARSPLFDPEIVALAAALPAHSKRRGPVEKWLLKEAVRDLLPPEILARPKSGMLVPVEAWFSGPLRGWATERLLEGLAPHKLVSSRFLERLMRRESGGLRPRFGVKVWLLLTLEAWLRVVYAV